MIINDLHRKKFDGNREIHEATFDEPNAVKAYHDYHGTITQVKNSLDEDYSLIYMDGDIRKNGLD